jgi:catechol 2,3-dioxygenase-like lactoylglutathione lyase family enzyme
MNNFCLSIEHQITFLYTANLAQSADFYENILEFPLILDQKTCRIYRTTPNSAIGFCQKDNFSPEPNTLILTLVTQDVDQWYQLLRAKGVSFDAPPQENPYYRIYHCFLRDPNGYRIEIQRFLHPF